MSACIYCIKNMVNGHSYIGQTKDYKSRKQKHLSELRKGRHCNMHLQRAYNKYGEENFVFSILENIQDYNSIGERERYWIEQLGYYNIDKGRNGFTPTALRNMSLSHIGRISEKRLLEDETVYKICAITEFCDGAVRKISSLTGIGRSTVKDIAGRKTYRDCWERYDELSFSDKLKLCKEATQEWGYDFWAATNCSCPKKYAYIDYLLRKTGDNYKQIAKICLMTPSGVRRAKNFIRKEGRKIDTTYSEQELEEIISCFDMTNAVENSFL